MALVVLRTAKYGNILSQGVHLCCNTGSCQSVRLAEYQGYCNRDNNCAYSFGFGEHHTWINPSRGLSCRKIKQCLNKCTLNSNTPQGLNSAIHKGSFSSVCRKVLTAPPEKAYQCEKHLHSDTGLGPDPYHPFHWNCLLLSYQESERAWQWVSPKCKSHELVCNS